MSAIFYRSSRHMLDPLIPRDCIDGDHMDRQICNFIQDGIVERMKIRKMLRNVGSCNYTTPNESTGPQDNGDKRSASSTHSNPV